jgi:hypothetical protein
MSTKKIRMLCECVANDPRMGSSFKEAARAALAEVDAIEKAAPHIVDGATALLTGFETGADFDKALLLMQSIAKENKGCKP